MFFYINYEHLSGLERAKFLVHCEVVIICKLNGNYGVIIVISKYWRVITKYAENAKMVGHTRESLASKNNIQKYSKHLDVSTKLLNLLNLASRCKTHFIR